MVIAVGTAITGVQLERTGLQHAADSAALAAA
ncbi:MAG: pilus assembly protein TadG-related protein, partial [Brachybacterium sp.]|nr:pilus assembly protein TadG-related protein [Brachybacterium sp.]